MHSVLFVQGERILRLAEMCRKLETEEEKVLPFYSTSLSPEEEDQVASVEGEPAFETLAQVRVCVCVCVCVCVYT